MSVWECGMDYSVRIMLIGKFLGRGNLGGIGYPVIWINYRTFLCSIVPQSVAIPSLAR